MAEINATTLMERLAKAKKVMDKVDSGSYSTGNINTAALNQNFEYNPNSAEVIQESYSTPKNVNQPQQLTANKIQNSKLPDQIKKAMMDNPIPIPSISLNENNFNMDFINGAKRLIEQDSVQQKKQVQPKSKALQENTPNIDMNSFSILIENVVRKVLDEKLNQILLANETKTVNESLVLKVGDSVFKGKITGVNSVK